MKQFVLIALVSLIAVNAYDREAVRSYAAKYWNGLNHNCNTAYSTCSPYSYWGGEHCGYASQGGDCANFVSQCLLAGGHPTLKGGACRGYPCGVEEIGATNLGVCLKNQFGWKRDCGYRMAPPSDLQVGDVLIYHASSCSDYSAHATVVVEVGSDPKIACHSSMHYGISYTYMANSKPYYEWLRYPGGTPTPPTPPTPTPTSGEKMVKVTSSVGINRRSGPSTSSSIVGGYVQGTKVQVVSKTGDWYKEAAGTYITADSRWVVDLVGTVTANALNVRASNSTSATVIELIYYGAKVTCLKSSNGWYYVITASGKKGWVYGSYLSF